MQRQRRDGWSAWLQGKFFDLRMQDVYNIVKCLQDLACATAATALVFVFCGGLSNLAAVLSWPSEGMRHARWAASVVMSDVSPCFTTHRICT